MADYLSINLYREILLRVLIKSLIRFMAVSKSWKSLITSRDFIYAHRSNATTHTLLLGGYGRRTERYLLMSTGSTGFNSCHELEFPKIPGVGVKDLSVVGYSDGLVCFTDAIVFSQEYSIIVSNLSIHKHVVLPKPITGVYKVVRIVYG